MIPENLVAVGEPFASIAFEIDFVGERFPSCFQALLNTNGDVFWWHFASMFFQKSWYMKRVSLFRRPAMDMKIAANCCPESVDLGICSMDMGVRSNHNRFVILTGDQVHLPRATACGS
jgi:hypothetical protein